MTRRSTRNTQLWVGLLMGVLTTLFSASAFAQTSGPSAALTTGAVVLHYLPDGVTPSSHPNGSQPSWISNADCQQNVIVRVPITMTNLPTPDTMQVWAGANGVDCTQAANLTGAERSCWPVLSGGIAPQTSVTVDIKAQDIVAGVVPAIGEKPTAPAGSAAACSTITQSGPIPITLFFMFFGGGTSANGADPGTTGATYALSVAIIGPAPPSNITVADGDTFLKVDWTPATDSNTQGFQLFCDPPPGKEPDIQDGASGATVVDSSTVEVCNDTTEDGGFDDAGNYLGDITVDGGCHYENQSSTSTVGGVCVSSEIVPGGGTVSSGTTDDSGVDTTDDGEGGVVLTNVTPPPANISQYSCGPGANLGSQTSSEAILSGLKNGATYVVGVAAYDVVGNIGPMGVGTGSNMCGSPAKGLDFFDIYNQDGGGAGGGFCSFDKTQPVGTSAFALVGLASLISIIRRRKKNSKTSGDARS